MNKAIFFASMFLLALTAHAQADLNMPAPDGVVAFSTPGQGINQKERLIRRTMSRESDLAAVYLVALIDETSKTKQAKDELITAGALIRAIGVNDIPVYTEIQVLGPKQVAPLKNVVKIYLITSGDVVTYPESGITADGLLWETGKKPSVEAVAATEVAPAVVVAEEVTPKVSVEKKVAPKPKILEEKKPSAELAQSKKQEEPAVKAETAAFEPAPAPKPVTKLVAKPRALSFHLKKGSLKENLKRLLNEFGINQSIWLKGSRCVDWKVLGEYEIQASTLAGLLEKALAGYPLRVSLHLTNRVAAFTATGIHVECDEKKGK